MLACCGLCCVYGGGCAFLCVGCKDCCVVQAACTVDAGYLVFLALGIGYAGAYCAFHYVVLCGCVTCGVNPYSLCLLHFAGCVPGEDGDL